MDLILFGIKVIIPIINTILNIKSYNKVNKLIKEDKMKKDTLTPDDSIVMAIEEMVNNSNAFVVSDYDQELALDTEELLKYIDYFSYEKDPNEIVETLLTFHNSIFVLYIDTPKGELYTVNAFFEYSPYDYSKITLLAESIELVEK